METITLEMLKRKFPRTGNALYAVSGPIPMDYFVANETAIRAAMAGKGLRVWYRGPRPQKTFGGKASATQRQYATHAVIYHRS